MASNRVALSRRAGLRAPEGRAAFLADVCADDEDLRREVESLLAQPVSVEGVLDGPVLAVAGPMMSDSPGASLVGRRLGVYQVVTLLGVGGMGRVYRARDTRLGRDVALKVLPQEFTAHPDRVARFEREARLLAALNHPHIAAIYGVEQFDGTHALVLELVEGETLAERIRGSGDRRHAVGLTLDDTLAIARQIAEALDAAHEKGIIHRDLKPANIKVTPGGVVKVLDFGIAKLAPSVDGDLTAGTGTPTMTVDPTRDGLIVGTAAYMSPEQARGQAVDKRTDIWAFGCLLYEMLTGRAAFARETITDTLAAVLEHEPDWTLLPDTTSPGVRRLLRRCLEKGPTQRLRDVGDARIDLNDPQASGVEVQAILQDPRSRRRAPTWTLAAAGLIVIGSVGALVWSFSRSAAETTAPEVTRTTLTLAPNHVLDTRAGAAPLAISPNGRRLAYVADVGGRTQLFVRSLDAFETQPIAGTDGAQYPFFSPDGEWVAFFAERKLKRVPIRGGSPLTVCDVPVIGRGGTWARDGTIVFDPGDTGLMRVGATGGQPEPLTTADATMDKHNLSWPQFLPDGRALLATVGEGSDADYLAVLSLETGVWHRLGPGSQAQYVPPGYLLYHAWGVAREGEIHAVTFDIERLTLGGNPVSMLENVFHAANAGAAYFVVAQNGTVMFTPGGYARTLVRVDRAGRRAPLLDDRRGFRGPEMSPDGLRVAVTVDPRPSQIWVYDLARRSGIPLTTNGHNLSPLWMPDGRRVTYASGDIFWRAADGSATPERLLARDGYQYPTSWSADGRLLIFNDQKPNDDFDIWFLPAGEQPRALIATADNEAEGQLSPDGRWLAYQSNESGRLEVYVRPFPNVNDKKWTISTAGGRFPLWSPNGRELFYGAGSALMSVPVGSGGSQFHAGSPELLFSGPFHLAGYSVTPDGSHFIMVEDDPNARPTQVHVVLNWHEELKQRVPTR